jgi:hypothetical protein
MNAQLQSRLKNVLEMPYVFQLILDEDSNQDIFEEFDMDQTKSTLGIYNHKLVTVISVQQIDEGYYALFKHKGEVIGWTAIDGSHYVYPKEAESVKVNLETLIPHPFNREIMGPMNLMIEYKDRLLSSKSFVEVEGEKLEMLFLKGMLRGFVRSEDLQKSRVMDEICLLKADAPRFRDSNFSVELPPREEDFEAEITLYFPDLGLVKLQYNNRVFWMHDTDIDFDFTPYNAYIAEAKEDVHQYYTEERQKVKSIIEALLKKQIQLEREADRAKTRLHRIETLYKNLRESKLGRIQVELWKRRKRRAK